MGSDNMRDEQVVVPVVTEVPQDDAIGEGATTGATSRTKAGLGRSGRGVADAATGAKETVRDAVQDVGKTVADATRHIFR